MTYQPKMIEASPVVWQAVMGADVDECKWEAAMLCLESHQPVTFRHNQCETPNHWARVALRAVQFAADINRAEAQIHHETPPLSYSNE